VPSCWASRPRQSSIFGPPPESKVACKPSGGSGYGEDHTSCCVLPQPVYATPGRTARLRIHSCKMLLGEPILHDGTRQLDSAIYTPYTGDTDSAIFIL